jgi:hypothetical protein
MKKNIKRNAGVRKTPIMVTKHGAAHIKEVRRETNDQIMRECLNTRGNIVLRVQPSLKKGNGQYYGWHGGSIIVEAPGVEKANLFVKRLQESIADIARELDLVARQTSSVLA